MTGRTKVIVLVALLVLVLALAVGCQDAPRNTGGSSAEPTETKLTGEQLYHTKCVYCHNDDRVDTATYDLAGWEGVIDRMVAKGAQVNDAEKAAIAEYLANR